LQEESELRRGSSHGSNLNVTIVKWENVRPWGAQLQLLRDADVMVSGIGTALFYSLLLPDGAVTVNLGWNRPRDAWQGVYDMDGRLAGGPPELPSYGEEFLGMSNRRARMLYLPLKQVRKGASTADLSMLLSEAEELVRNGFEIPISSPEDNLGVFGKIILDLERRSESSFRGLNGLPQRDGDEFNVQEEIACHTRAVGQSSATDLVYEQALVDKLPTIHQNQSILEPCHIDVELLRELKLEHKLPEELGLTATCECVVCEDCGFSESIHERSQARGEHHMDILAILLLLLPLRASFF
jgi:hypothetical protein